jgi:hypothetical protein
MPSAHVISRWRTVIAATGLLLKPFSMGDLQAMSVKIVSIDLIYLRRRRDTP